MSYAQAFRDVLNRMNMPQDKRDIIERTKADSATQAQGLQRGDLAPDFSLSNQDGGLFSLHAQLLKGPVVISFFRGSWCTFCALHMKAWAQSLNEIQATGAELVAVHPESIATSKEFHHEASLNFPLLADLDQAVMKAYDLQFRVHKEYEEMGRSNGFLVADQNADGSWNLPIPATYLVGSDGIIASAWVDHDYWNRAEAADVIAAIKRL